VAKHAHNCAFCVAMVCAWRGQKDRAFEWLDRACGQRSSAMTEIKYQRAMDSLLGDPRYQALMRRMNLPQ
jgi:hypothetical protein